MDSDINAIMVEKAKQKAREMKEALGIKDEKPNETFLSRIPDIFTVSTKSFADGP